MGLGELLCAAVLDQTGPDDANELRLSLGVALAGGVVESTADLGDGILQALDLEAGLGLVFVYAERSWGSFGGLTAHWG